jgi:hypothetical protein
MRSELAEVMKMQPREKRIINRLIEFEMRKENNFNRPSKVAFVVPAILIHPFTGIPGLLDKLVLHDSL